MHLQHQTGAIDRHRRAAGRPVAQTAHSNGERMNQSQLHRAKYRILASRFCSYYTKQRARQHAPCRLPLRHLFLVELGQPLREAHHCDLDDVRGRALANRVHGLSLRLLTLLLHRRMDVRQLPAHATVGKRSARLPQSTACVQPAWKRIRSSCTPALQCRSICPTQSTACVSSKEKEQCHRLTAGNRSSNCALILPASARLMSTWAASERVDDP